MDKYKGNEVCEVIRKGIWRVSVLQIGIEHSIVVYFWLAFPFIVYFSLSLTTVFIAIVFMLTYLLKCRFKSLNSCYFFGPLGHDQAMFCDNVATLCFLR
jgi:hypothetical protein